MIRTHKIKTWHDRDIEAGSEWEPAIQNQLNRAEIIILLISADFINSEYCYGNELKRAIARHDAGEATVIPVILKPCLWNLREIPFSKLNVLPDHARPITKWEDPEEAFANVAQQIWNVVENLRNRKVAQQESQQQEAEQQRQTEEQERLNQQALERQRQEQFKQEAENKRQQEQANQQKPSSDALRGDYARLEALLKAGNWREADEETAKQMCQIMGRQAEGWLRVEDIEQFPCVDLRAIDHLWVMHSKGQFGFSVQKKIYLECGAKPDGRHPGGQIWNEFGDRVGWRVKGNWIDYNEVTYLLPDVREGHLPFASCREWGFVASLGLGFYVGFGAGFISSLAHRLVNCSI